MATRKTGSRRIMVDGVAYRWRVRRRPTNGQTDYGTGCLHIAVDSAEQPGSTLILLTDRPHPKDWGTVAVVPITPVDVARWVRQAVKAGWSPAQPGPQFHLRVSSAGPVEPSA